MDEPYIDSDPEQLDLDFIHDFISSSYWGKTRTRAEMELCIQQSMNFGIYLGKKQIGYARVLSDFCVLAYLMDLFIDPAYRGKGYARKLLEHILQHHTLAGIGTWRLSTSDGHGLYAKYGFKTLDDPNKMMEKKINR